MECLTISDLHLGDGSKADDFGDNDNALIEWIESHNPDVIVLNGDIYECWQFKMKRIKKAHKELLDYFKTKKVIQLIGNHDYKLFGKKTYILNLNDGDTKSKSTKIFWSHGNWNDTRMDNPVVRGFIWFLGIVERLPFMGKIDNPDMWSKKRNSADIKTEEYAHEKLKTYNIVNVGHTHKKLIEVVENRKHVNSGTCQHGNFEGSILETETQEIRLVS